MMVNRIGIVLTTYIITSVGLVPSLGSLEPTVPAPISKNQTGNQSDNLERKLKS
jgi:hypothetical protein